MLWLSGPPRLMLGDTPAPRLPDKVYALVCLVNLVFGGVADRGALAERLWEEGSASAARANLRNLLSRLMRWQKQTGLRLVHFDTSRVWRAADCVPTDLDTLLGAGMARDDAEVDALCHLYRGQLLAGCASEFSTDLNDTLLRLGQRVKDRLLDRVLPAAERGGAECLAALRQLAAELPTDERVLRSLLTHLSRQPSRDEAARVYGAFCARLRQEAGAVPELATRLLASSLGASADRLPATATPGAMPPQHRGLPRVLILPPDPHTLAKPAALRAATALIDDVTFRLCRLRSFAVIAPHTARAISRGVAAPSPGLHAADYVLYTSLLPGTLDGDYRLGFSLTRALSSEVLLGEALRFSLSDLPVRQADLTRLVTRLVATGIERTELGSFRTSDTPTAYVYYLIGQERLRMVDLPDLRAARKAFQHALELAPGFAPAMSMIARTLSLEWFLLNRGDDELLAQSARMAARAVELDPFDPSGHRELGNAALYSHDLDASLEHSAIARERAPHHADVLLDHADALAHNSRYYEAKRVIDAALALNPIAPDEYLWVAATIQFFLHDYRGALERALGMANPEPLGRLIAASAHLLGDRDTAQHWRLRMLERHPDFRVADWGRIVPIRNSTDKRFYEDAMRAAGFP